MKTILEDGREIEQLSLGGGPMDVSTKVGVNGVTKIVAYAEPGPGLGVPYFAVYVGDRINERVPAAMAVVTYKDEAS